MDRRFEYVSGKFFGETEEGKPAKTILSFMVQSVAGSYKDMISLCPISNLDAELLYKEFCGVLKCLTEVGFDVVAISVDNATPNRRFFNDILCKGKLRPFIDNPYALEKNIFLLFDVVHGYKNLYNNFVNKKNSLSQVL